MVYPEGAFYAPPRRLVFSRREVRELSLATLILLLVGFSWFGFHFHPYIVGAVLIGVLPAFLLHELAHKFSAQRQGLWAEFRIDPIGLTITAISILAPFKVVAPGAVVVWTPYPDSSLMGRISAYGPLTNIALAILFLAFNPLLPHYLAEFAIRFNAFIAFFNLLPFGIFDGRKIIAWSWKLWGVLIVLAVILMVLPF